MRILRIITRLNIGGPAVHAVLLSTGLEPSRFSTCLIVGHPETDEGDLSGTLDGTRVRVVRVSWLGRSIRPWADARSLLRLLRLVWRERPQIIHTHMAKAGALGRLAGVLYNRWGPGRRRGQHAILIHTFHGHVLEGYFSPPLSRIFITIEQWLARRTDRLIAVSRAIRDELLDKGVGRPEQWEVIPLGLELSELARVSVSDGIAPLRVGWVGRLVPIKNPSMFLEAVQQVVRENAARPMSAVIVGDGPLRGRLQQQTRGLGVESVVEFTGWQRDLPALYAQLDMVVLTSWNEGTPLALIEAMAAGRPVIATAVGGVTDLLADGKTTVNDVPEGSFRLAPRGVLIRPGDAAGLAAAVQALAVDVPLRHRLASVAREFALGHFSHERLLSDVTALYERLATTEG